MAKQHDTVDQIERMDRYQRAAKAGTGSAQLAKAMYDHCHRHHRYANVPTLLRWPEPENIVVSEPNYFGFGSIDVTGCSIRVDVSPINSANYVPHALTAAEAETIDLVDVRRKTGPRAGDLVRLRFRVTDPAQLASAFRLLDRAHALTCRALDEKAAKERDR